MIDNNILIYNIIKLGFGLLVIFWGYRLLTKGLSKVKTGTIKGVWRDWSIVLENTSPGVFFLIGGIVIIFFRGIDNKTQTKKILEESPASENVIIDSSFSDVRLIKNINKDSIFYLSKENINEKKYLDALKNLFLLKGILYNEEKMESRKEEIDINIKIASKFLLETLRKPPQEKKTSEETTTETHTNDETIDTTNQ